MKKLTTVKTLREKVFCKQWSNFFSKFEIRQWNGVVTKKWIEVLKLASVRSACVCIVFFFQYFKYYGQNIFSRTMVSYLIAKVERKQTLYLKHEFILYQKGKRSKIFLVKTISKDVRKTIVPSFMLHFNLSKSFLLYVKKI